MNAMEKIFVLKKVSLFASLTLQGLRAISLIAREKTFAENEQIISEGEGGEAFYAITAGRVMLYKGQNPLESDQGVILRMLKAHEHFGESALLDGEAYAENALSIEPTTTLVLTRDEFEELMLEFPAIPVAICREFSRQLRRMKRYLEIEASGT